MTRQDSRQIVSQFAEVSGWFLLGAALALGLGLFLIPPTKSKGGGPEAPYEVLLLFAIPALLVSSALLRFLARGARSVGGTWAYWIAFVVAVIPWWIALSDISARGGGPGFQQALREFGL